MTVIEGYTLFLVIYMAIIAVMMIYVKVSQRRWMPTEEDRREQRARDEEIAARYAARNLQQEVVARRRQKTGE